jgi:hypothetical protein
MQAPATLLIAHVVHSLLMVAGFLLALAALIALLNRIESSLNDIESSLNDAVTTRLQSPHVYLDESDDGLVGHPRSAPPSLRPETHRRRHAHGLGKYCTSRRLRVEIPLRTDAAPSPTVSVRLPPHAERQFRLFVAPSAALRVRG